MKKIISVVFCFLLFVGFVPMSDVHAGADAVFPCGTDLFPLTNENDTVFLLDGSMGGGSVSFTWSGVCPGVVVDDPDEWTPYNIRIASDFASGDFYSVTAEELFAGGNFTPLIYELYVPDSRVQEFTDRGLAPIPFSAVSDWSFQSMLGASPTDATAQWILRQVLLGESGSGHLLLDFAMLPETPNPADFYIAWDEVEGELPVLFPCDDTYLSYNSEVDSVFNMGMELFSGSGHSFEWYGACPGVVVASDVKPYANYSMRVAGDWLSGRFFTQTEQQLLTGQIPVNVSYELYVPDSRVQEFTDRGLAPIPFSSVSDWGFDNMLGASEGDTAAQWIIRDVALGGVEGSRKILIFSMLSISPHPADFWINWKGVQIFEVYLPLITR